MKKLHFLDQFALDQRAKETEYFADQKISNNFWTIKNACDTKETGANFPQVKKIIGGNYQPNKPNSVRNIRYDTIPTEDFIDFGTLQIYKTSKLSDTISSGGPGADGFYLSEKAKDVFSKFNLGEHKYFQANVEHKDIIYRYFYLQVKNDFNQYINFDKSLFYIQQGMLNGPREVIKAKSIIEITKLKDQLFEDWRKGAEYKEVGIENIVLENSTPNIDIFSFGRFGAELFITKTVKDAIERDSLTGFQIDDQRKIDRT